MAEPQAEVAEPVAEPELTLVAEAPVAEDEPANVAVEAPVAAEEPTLEAPATVDASLPVAFEAPVSEVEPVVAAFEESPIADVLTVAGRQDEEFAFEAPEIEVEVPVATIIVGAAVADPAARWASMAPGGVTERRSTSSPVDSWTRLRPGHTADVAMSATNGQRTATMTAVAPMPTAVEVTSPSLAWWDVPSGMESDPRRGRFALGGYALQPGHHVVSGVTFRDGVVPPPTHWVIGPVVGEVAPGTLVLHVDGCLNCRPEDLAVLTDPGFAPTTDGFSLRLAAAATGPFAASGTYVIS